MKLKMYRRETYKTREEWLQARGLGGSAASAILDLNPYMSKMELYNACISGKKGDTGTTNKAMIYGTKCEKHIRAIVRENFFDIIKVKSPREHEMYRRIDKPYLTATLDGVLTILEPLDDPSLGHLEKGVKGILEIKTHDVRNRADAENWNGSLPMNYFVQVLHYLMVMTDFEFAMLVAKLRYFNYGKGGKTIDREEIRYYRISRSDPNTAKQISFLEQKETEFWEENVTKRKIPAVKIG